ncbi:hypothetical protein ACOMHN_060878 [Nucella lapillus]
MYLHVKRLLTSGACDRQAAGVEAGDHLLRCNGHSLRSLTQRNCLQLLQHAGPRVTLTLLRHLPERNPPQESRAGTSREKPDCQTRPSWSDSKDLGRSRQHGSKELQGLTADDCNERKCRFEGAYCFRTEIRRETEYNFGTEYCIETNSRTESRDSARLGEGVNARCVTTVPHERDAISDFLGSGDERHTASTCSTGPGTRWERRTQTCDISVPPLTSSSSALTSSAMSNPFLDPLPLGATGDDTSDCGPQNGHSSVQDVSKDNPFYEDLLGGELTCGTVVDNSLPDTLIEFQDDGPDPASKSDRVATEDVLLDLGDGSGGGAAVQPSGELVDLLGSNDIQFGEPFGGIPPPMEFSDPFSANGQVSAPSKTFASPVTNIDDLLGLDFMTSLDSVTEEDTDLPCSKPDGVCSNDLLQDIHVLSESAPTAESMDAGEMSPQLPSDPPPVPTKPPPDLPEQPPPVMSVDRGHDTNVTVHALNDYGIDDLSSPEEQTQSPPPVPTNCPVVDVNPPGLSEQELSVLTDDNAPFPFPVGNPSIAICECARIEMPKLPPPLVPADQLESKSGNDFIAAESNDLTDTAEQQEDTVNSSDVTTLFLPSQNPTDNVTQVSVTPANKGHKDDSSNSNNSIHITDIAVTSAAASVSSVNVTKPKPAPREADIAKNKAGTGSVVVLVDNSSMPSATHIQFDNSTQQTVVQSTLPPNAFIPTSVGITRAVKPSPTTAEAEEEEQITPMTVHRDHQGNKMAAPSPPETLGRQWQKPRTLDQAAKRDLQVVLSRMTVVGRGSGTKRKPAEDGPVAQEEEIVPVKLTRQEAEMAREVLCSWMSRDKEPSPFTPPSPIPQSSFQKVVGTVINIQSGKEPLPDNCLFLTTVGVTKTKSSTQEGGREEEEEIISMALHKDHLGNKHYAPSPPPSQSLGKQSGRRQVDSAAKRGIADLLSGMAPRAKSMPRGQSQAGEDVAEEHIVATVMSREQSGLATEAITKWLADEKPSPSPSSLPFHRLVENVMDAADKTGHIEVTHSVDQTDAQTEQSQGHNLNSNDTAEHTETVVSQSVQLQSTAPPTDTKPYGSPRQISTQSSPSLKDTSPLSTQNVSQITVQKMKTPSEQPHQKNTDRLDPVQQGVTQTVISKNTSAIAAQPVEAKTVLQPVEAKTVLQPVEAKTVVQPVEAKTTSATDVEAKPLSSQKAQTTATSSAEASAQSSQSSVRASAKISSLSQPSYLNPKPKLAPLSVTNRAPVSAFVSSRLSTRMDYAKTRNDDSPFLVEVLKGIVGLGIKVKVNGEGHVEVTEVQRNSPLDKNGNIRLGDYVLSINTTELRGLADGRVQQVLRLLPRGLVKLVVTTRPPPPLTPAHSNEVTNKASPRSGGAYSPYGVRLSARPFSPSTDRPSPALASPVVALETALTPARPLSPSPSSTVVHPPPAVTQSVSSAHTVSPLASLSSSVSSTSTGTTALTTSSLPPSEKDALSSTPASSENCDVTARVSPAREAPVPSAQRSSVSVSSEPRASPGTRQDRSLPQPVPSSLPNRDSQVSQKCPPDTGPDRPTAPPTVPPPTVPPPTVPLPTVPPPTVPPPTVPPPTVPPPTVPLPTVPPPTVPPPTVPLPTVPPPTVPLPTVPPPTVPPPTVPPAKEPLSISIPEVTEVDDMEAHKLSRALSPRLPSASSQPAEQTSPPKPSPRQRISVSPVASPVVERRKLDGHEDGDDDGGSSPEPEHRPLTASELVTAASKRPSGRDPDLPSPPSSPRVERVRTARNRPRQEPQDPPPSSPTSVRTTARVASPRQDVSPAVSTVSKTSPVPTPRPRSRLSVGTKLNRSDEDPFSKDVSQKSVQKESQVSVGGPDRSSNSGGAVVHAHMVTIGPQAAAPPPAEAAQSKVPPPVAQRSRQPLLSDSSAKEAPCPTLVSARLRAFADSNVPTLEDQAQNRKFVSSAARMFEQKASEGNISLPFSKHTKSSMSVSSLVKSLNHQDVDTSGVTMRKKPAGSRADRGDPDFNDRRKSTPIYFTGSSLSVSSNLSHVKNLSASTVTLSGHEPEPESSQRLNSALSPRLARANTTSLKSVLANEGRRPRSPPSVGKSSESKRASMLSDVTLRSRPSRHDPHQTVTSQSNRKSWSPQTSDSLYPRPLTATSPCRTDRFGSSLSSSLSSSMTTLVSPRRSAPRSGNADSAVRKFDDLLTTRHAVDSDDELPKVSNSLSLDFSSRSRVRAEGSHRNATHTTEGREKTVEQSTGRREAGKRSIQQSADRAGSSQNNEQQTVEGRTGRNSEHHSARRAEVNIKSLQQSTSESPLPPLSLSSTLPSCWKSPDDFLVEERKTFTFGDNEIRNKKEEDLLEKNTPTPPEIQHKSDLLQTSEAVREAVVGYIVTGGKQQRNSPQARTSRRAQASQSTTASQQPDRQGSSPPEVTVTRRTRRERNQTEDGEKSAAHAVASKTDKEQTALVNIARPGAVVDRDVKEKKDLEGDDDDSPPPPLPDEGPPPLPGAPPPALAVCPHVDIADVRDLEGMLPSKETRTSAAHTTVTSVDTMEPGVSASSFGISQQQTVTASQSKEGEPVPAADPVSPHSPPSRFSTPSTAPDLPSEVGYPGKDKDRDNNPVSDTLSQDSGVQDEDMSEEGLRLSMDDSTTSTSLIDTAITPDEVPASVLTQSLEDPAPVESGVKVSPKPVAATRRRALHAFASPVSPPITTTPHTAVESTAGSAAQTVAPKGNHSEPQASASQRCSSEQREAMTPAVPGGVSTTGEPSKADGPSHTAQVSTHTSVAARHTRQAKAEMNTETRARTTHSGEEQNQQTQPRQRKEMEKKVDGAETEKKTDGAATGSHSRPEHTLPSQTRTEDDQEIDDEDDDDEEEEAPTPQTEDDSSPDWVEVNSPRKWCILDQSGSLFLQGAGDIPVQVGSSQLWQVSSLRPADLLEAVQSANGDLDQAKLPLTLELRLVSARQLGGQAVALDVAQREDYFVQVTKVHSKDGSVQQADLLLSVDGHSQRHRRPAQVHSQLTDTGPKGVLLTARGLKLPPSVAGALAAATASAGEQNMDIKGTSTPPPSSPRTPRAADSPAKAVEVGEGVYEVTMTKGPAGVGFCLEGGKGSSKGDLPILIKRIFKGGLADKSGVLKVKDEVVSVNGVDYSSMGHYEAWNLLKAVQDGPITLRIRRQP